MLSFLLISLVEQSKKSKNRGHACLIVHGPFNRDVIGEILQDKFCIAVPNPMLPTLSVDCAGLHRLNE